ncbi:hypothetical protein M378DRAFT_739746 [Amanita muscaria Koide BX008]|uniref:Uncharacterized protein n=1 Tax=Amanita muscaria (strain Koide BX008) TaxID=946122 RepID=A0A0C2X2I6_AMAMK|nr:hypothetical protein M378DRAFT_739746 [Amanita muscaria Koide BX008]
MSTRINDGVSYISICMLNNCRIFVVEKIGMSEEWARKGDEGIRFPIAYRDIKEQVTTTTAPSTHHHHHHRRSISIELFEDVFLRLMHSRHLVILPCHSVCSSARPGRSAPRPTPVSDCLRGIWSFRHQTRLHRPKIWSMMGILRARVGRRCWATPQKTAFSWCMAGDRLSTGGSLDMN